MKVTQSCLTLRQHGLYSSWNSPGQNTGVGSLSLLQGIFLMQGSNPGLPYCRQILYCLSHKGSPRITKWVAYPFSRGSSPPRDQTRVSCIAGRFFTNWAMRKAYLLSFKIVLIISSIYNTLRTTSDNVYKALRRKKRRKVCCTHQYFCCFQLFFLPSFLVFEEFFFEIFFFFLFEEILLTILLGLICW